MDSTDLGLLKQRTRAAYERSRLKRALLGILPLGILIGLAAWLAPRPAASLGFGAAAFGLGVYLLWYGREPQRAVLPGIGAGVIPLVLAIGANYLHVCGPSGCGSLCVPACALGGVMAGLGVASAGNRRRLGGWFWVSASGLALLVGAMGCACVGYAGIIGLGGGFSAGIAPSLMWRALGKK